MDFLSHREGGVCFLCVTGLRVLSLHGALFGSLSYDSH